MAVASASIVPWFTHRRMWSKWFGFAVTAALTAMFWHPMAWTAWLVGILWFFPNEYVIHRFVYHRWAVGPDPPSPARSHIKHHVDPTDLDYIFNEPRVSVPAGFLYIGLAYVVTWDWGLAGAFSLGNFTALLYYDHVHFTAHRPGVTPVLPWNRFLKKMHLWHHYKSEHHWFGVTNALFDRLFGSWRDPDTVEKSATVRSLQPPDALRAWADEPG